MKSRILSALAAAALLCCASCVKANYELGGSLIPVDQTYSVYTAELPFTEIYSCMADSLSGYSNKRLTIGAVRDAEFGLTTRSCALTLVPLNDTLIWGSNPRVKRFHFAAAKDTTSTMDDNGLHILQNVRVYELDAPLDASRNFDINAPVSHRPGTITMGTPVINGSDSLSFDFDLTFASRFLGITQADIEDMDAYLKKLPGIYITTDAPSGNGGRINSFDLQLGYDKENYYLTGNYAQLDIETTIGGVKKDTSYYFYYSPVSKISTDSLLTTYSTGSFPQYALNVCSHETRARAGKAEGERIMIEGGGGLKPVIRAKTLKAMAQEMIAAKGATPNDVVINKASIILPFDFPKDYTEMDRFPYILSPTCRIQMDTVATFMGLTDSSSEDENQGNIDRSNLQFAPDITYHLQEILKIKDNETAKIKRLENGSLDVWMLITANEITTTTNSNADSEMSDYYKYLAYQSYYNNMYGGYGGYGYGGYGYGYGGYGYGGYGDYYSNYYTYMMMAQYANSSTTTTSTSQELDTYRWYKGWLNGPAHPDRVPTLRITFSVPNSAN